MGMVSLFVANRPQTQTMPENILGKKQVFYNAGDREELGLG